MICWGGGSEHVGRATWTVGSCVGFHKLRKSISICDLSYATAEGQQGSTDAQMHTQRGREMDDASQCNRQSLGSTGCGAEEGDGCMEGNV